MPHYSTKRLAGIAASTLTCTLLLSPAALAQSSSTADIPARELFLSGLSSDPTQSQPISETNESPETETATTAEIRPNVFNFVGGATNVASGTFFTNPLTGKADISYTIQMAPLLRSSVSVQTSGSEGYVFVPKVIENPSFTLIARPDSVPNFFQDALESENRDALRIPVSTVNLPVEIVDGFAIDPETGWLPDDLVIDLDQNAEGGENQLPKMLKLTSEMPADSSFVFELQNFLGPNQSSEEMLAKYDVYLTSMARQGVHTLSLTGSVTPEAMDVYLPVRAITGGWRCSQEGAGPGSYEQGCQSLFDYRWHAKGELPDYSLSDAALNAQLARLNTVDGLTGSERCAVTANNNNDLQWIGVDITPSQSAPDGLAESYTQTFNLGEATWVNYSVSGLDEDACDQAAARIAKPVVPVPVPIPVPSTTETPQPQEPQITPQAQQLTPQAQQPEKPQQPEKRVLANTGPNVVGLLGLAGVLIAAGVVGLLRRQS